MTRCVQSSAVLGSSLTGALQANASFTNMLLGLPPNFGRKHLADTKVRLAFLRCPRLT